MSSDTSYKSETDNNSENNVKAKHNKNKEYYNNTKYNLVLKKSKIKNAGLGVFSNDEIKKGKLLGQYDGKLVETKKDDYDPDYTMEINEKYLIDGSIYPRPFTSMINDAYGTRYLNNCEFVVKVKHKKVEIRTTRQINRGDELLIDYGADYWNSRA